MLIFVRCVLGLKIGILRRSITEICSKLCFAFEQMNGIDKYLCYHIHLHVDLYEFHFCDVLTEVLPFLSMKMVLFFILNKKRKSDTYLIQLYFQKYLPYENKFKTELISIQFLPSCTVS